MTSKIPEPWATAMERVGIPSYRRLASKAGLSVGTVHMALTGQRRSVAPATIVGLSRALRLPEETISEYLGMGQQTIQEYTPPEEASMLTRRERDAVDELIRLLVASRAKPHDDAGTYVDEAEAKRALYEQNPDAYHLAAKHHDKDPLDGLGEENQDLKDADDAQ